MCYFNILKGSGHYKCKNLENSSSERNLPGTPFLGKNDEKIDIFNKNINTRKRKKVIQFFMYPECYRERPLQSTSKLLTNSNFSPQKTPDRKSTRLNSSH